MSKSKSRQTTPTTRYERRQNIRTGWTLVLGIILLLGGATLCVVPQFVAQLQSNNKLCIYGGLAIGGVGLIIVLVCWEILAHRRKLSKQDNHIAELEVMADAEVKLDGTSTYNGAKVAYIPSEEVYNFVNMGDYQSVDEKFDQISKMDKTQFVIYVARLFSRKGYQVKLTPVIDNYDIDMIVEKMGTTIAVGCILTNKVLCQSDITCVAQGVTHYNINNVMVLTNMYFDRTALDYAKSNKMSLVDRNILAEDFMN